MARGRSKARNKEKEVPETKKKITNLVSNRAWAVIIAITLVSVSAGIWYWNDNKTPGNISHIDRTIFFPKDEGHHTEIFETWDIYLTLNYGAKGLGVSVQYAASYLSTDPARMFYRSVRISDDGNLTGSTYRFVTMATGNITCPEDKLNLSWQGSGSTDHLSRVSNAEYLYKYKMSYTDYSGLVLSLDCTMTAIKNPILIGSEGKILLMEYGTLYGYFQPRLEITGTLAVGGGSAQPVTGICWLNHNWGALSNYNQESYYLNLDNYYDMMFARYFIPNQDTPGLMYVYNIFPDGRYELTKWVPEMPSYTIRVDAKGTYQQLGIAVNYTFDIERYWRSLDDTARSKCYASVCRVRAPERSLDFTISPKFEKQYTVQWLGQVDVAGEQTLEQNGQGYASLIYRYSSELEIRNVTDNRPMLDSPTSPTTIKARILHTLPMDNVTIVYRENSGAEHRVQMVPDENDLDTWKGVIPGDQTLHTIVYYKITAYDRAGRPAETDWNNYPIEVIIP